MMFCKKCNTMKTRDDFPDNKIMSTGKQSACKECRREIARHRKAAGAAYLKANKQGNESNSDVAIRYVVEDVERSADALAYLMRNTTLKPDTNCFLWSMATDDSGYGRASIALPTNPSSNTTILAHRFMFALTNWQQLPNGERDGSDGTQIVIDHLCNERACLNPSHLSLIEQTRNSSLQRTDRVAPTGYGKIIDITYAPDWAVVK